MRTRARARQQRSLIAAATTQHIRRRHCRRHRRRGRRSAASLRRKKASGASNAQQYSITRAHNASRKAASEQTSERASGLASERASGLASEACARTAAQIVAFRRRDVRSLVGVENTRMRACARARAPSNDVSRSFTRSFTRAHAPATNERRVTRKCERLPLGVSPLLEARARALVSDCAAAARWLLPNHRALPQPAPRLPNSRRLWRFVPRTKFLHLHAKDAACAQQRNEH